jgi:hypothetical protein
MPRQPYALYLGVEYNIYNIRKKKNIFKIDRKIYAYMKNMCHLALRLLIRGSRGDTTGGTREGQEAGIQIDFAGI